MRNGRIWNKRAVRNGTWAKVGGTDHLEILECAIFGQNVNEIDWSNLVVRIDFIHKRIPVLLSQTIGRGYPNG